MTIDVLSAFIIGILGSGHCLGMCGGITSMLTSAISPTQVGQRVTLVTSYHIGRLASYSLLGAIVGFTGSFAAKNIGIPFGWLRMVAALFLILLGLYIGQWLFLLSKLESVGKLFWQYISPLSRRVLPVDSPIKALSLGAIWGWLPCGLVYSTLTWSLASANPLMGAGIMLFFGLGTLPALFSLSFGFFSLNQLIKNVVFRKTMALIIIIYGFFSLKIAYSMLF